MGTLHLVRRNLGRKKLRTLFTLLSIVIAFMLFALLSGLSKAFTVGLDVAGADRLITMHRVSFIQLLPLSYVRRVEAMEGVEAVGQYTWFGAYYQDPRQQFGLFPTEMETLRGVYPEYTIPDDQWQNLLNTRTGLLIGQAMAEEYGWEVGDQVPLFSSIYPQQNGEYGWTFEIAAIFTGGGNDAEEMQAFMHYEYFNEARAFGHDMVGWIVTRITDPDDSDAISRAIDDRFANSPTETKTSTEQGWAAGFAAQVGNIGLIVQSIIACVFFSLLFIAGNTMAQAVRERTGELAVMKTIGFSDTRILLMVLGESMMVALLGGLIGLALGVLFLTGAAEAMARFLPGLAMSLESFITGVVLAAALGIVTGILPAWQAGRLKVVDALGRR